MHMQKVDNGLNSHYIYMSCPKISQTILATSLCVHNYAMSLVEHGHYDDDVRHGYHDTCDWNDSCDFDDYALHHYYSN